MQARLKTSAPRVIVGAVLLAGLWPAAVAGQEVQFLTVTYRNTENVLEWVNPATYDTVRILFNSGVTCTPPPDANSGTLLPHPPDPDGPGDRDRFSHGGLTNGLTYCYAVFVDFGGTYSLAGRSNGRPMDTTGPVKWAFSIGVLSMTPPTVGTAGIIAVSNAYVLHAMERGAASPPGGEWPALWLPKPIGGPVQSRSPVIPIDVGGTNPVVYLGSQDGNVYVVDGVKGGAGTDPWSPVALGGFPGQAAPAGIFTAFGGSYDYLLVGTHDGTADNRFYAINPIDGTEIDYFDNSAGTTGGIGAISGMATVDYANNLVYFASRPQTGAAKSNSSLWCLNLEPSPTFLSLAWERNFNAIDSAPVVAGGRVYVVGVGPARLYSVEATLGVSSHNTVLGDGPVKDFVRPDRRNPGDIYFATDTKIWAMHDNGTNAFVLKPPLTGTEIILPGATPTSGVLLVPGTQYLYVGANDGRLYEIDVSTDPAGIKSVPLGDGLAAVGSPSLDWPNNLIHVGTEAGIFYAVQVPL